MDKQLVFNNMAAKLRDDMARYKEAMDESQDDRDNYLWRSGELAAAKFVYDCMMTFNMGQVDKLITIMDKAVTGFAKKEKPYNDGFKAIVGWWQKFLYDNFHQ